VPTPIILIDTAGVAHDKRANIVFDTPFNYIFRKGMQEVVFPLREFFTRPLCLLGRAVGPLGLVFFLLEVVFVLTQSVPRIQKRIVGKRDGGRITDSKVNTSNLLTG